jgi:hypothetical protein
MYEKEDDLYMMKMYVVPLGEFVGPQCHMLQRRTYNYPYVKECPQHTLDYDLFSSSLV